MSEVSCWNVLAILSEVASAFMLKTVHVNCNYVKNLMVYFMDVRKQSVTRCG